MYLILFAVLIIVCVAVNVLLLKTNFELKRFVFGLFNLISGGVLWFFIYPPLFNFFDISSSGHGLILVGLMALSLLPFFAGAYTLILRKLFRKNLESAPALTSTTKSKIVWVFFLASMVLLAYQILRK